MKKVVLSAMALIMGATMVAQQNNPITNLSGDTSPDAVTSGTVRSTGNGGWTLQQGNDNKSQVLQAGTSQDVVIKQQNFSADPGNLARVMQTGNVGGNQALSGQDNLANVSQNGSANQSQTFQEGDRNMAITNQGVRYGAVSNGNKAYIKHGIGQNGEDNYAAVEQYGTGQNQARTIQVYDNNDAWTIQDGMGNKSDIHQDAGPNQSSGHEAANEQYGMNNESFIAQIGAGESEAKMYQDGDGNIGVQNQATGTGDWNYAGMVQEYGNTNVGFQTQSGGGSNVATMTQFFGDGNYGEQVQSGDSNTANISQYFGNENYAKQDQLGDDNEAYVTQGFGSGNKSLQTQEGDSNLTSSGQYGNENKSNVHQRGFGNWGFTYQQGNENASLLVQRGDSHTYYVDQVGNGNQSNVLQLGPTGNFETDGIDCYFDEQLTPPTYNDITDLNLETICGGC